jgi:3-oxoacyl-[acyl-carrier protein] reductase
VSAAALEHKAVVVTGGSRGIGRAVVLGALARGARVAFCARTLGPETAAVIDEGERVGGPGSVRAITADVSTEAGVDALFAAAVGAFGAVEVVVNNAAISRAALLVSLGARDWDDVVSVNATGAFLVARRALQAFRSGGVGGVLVSVGSIAQHGAPANASYAASKGALAALTRAAAAEGEGRGGRAHLVVVGYVATELTDDLPAATRRLLVETCPQRRGATPAEIADVVLALAAGAGGAINGGAIYASGGLGEIPAWGGAT